MVRPFSSVVDSEDEMADLQRRFHLLEGDRKAFFEASQWTIKQNKETLDLVKRENKELREALVALQRERGRSKHEKSGPATVEKLNEEVNELKSKYNEIRHLTQQKQKEFTRKQDELRDTERDSQAPSDGEHPAIKNIRGLEAKLERALMKCKEADSFQRTYKHIKKRLKEERRTFDVQLSSVQATLRAKEQDLQELVSMSNEAQHAKEASKLELLKLEQTISEERKVRERELAERRKLVQAKIELNQRMEKRERKRKELQLEAAGELNTEGEQTLIKNYVSQGFYSASAEHELQMQKEKVTTYEEAFRRIKEATGIEDVNEVISKFLTQDETAANLTQMTKEAQARIEALNEEKSQAKAKVEELRYAGPGSFGSRRIVDEYDAKLNEANSKCERQRKRHDRISRLLVNGQAGIEHLSERLSVVKLEDQVLKQHRLQYVAPPVTDSTVMDALRLCELKLGHLMNMKKEEDTMSADGSASETEEDHVPEPQQQKARPFGVPALNLDSFDIPVNNVRVPLSDDSGEDEESETEVPVVDPDEADDEEVVLDRGALKDSALATVERAVRKGKARARRRHQVDDDGPARAQASFTPRPPKGQKPTGRRGPRSAR